MELAPVSKKIVAFGSKQVFLPKFTVALIRTPNLSPYHAKFLVPLNFSKYDLRDYLYHAYSVKVHSIRSLVKQMPVRDTSKQPRHWFRPESQKFMTVEMEKPFVWPENPESWEAWGKKEKEASSASAKAYQGVETARDIRNNAKQLRQQAMKLLGAKERVRKQDPKKTKEDKAEALKERVEEEEPVRDVNATRKLAKSKKLNADVLRRWEEGRTPQILGRSLRETNTATSA